MKRKKKPKKTQHITIRISNEMMIELKKKATDEDTSISTLGREGLAFILKRQSNRIQYTQI